MSATKLVLLGIIWRIYLTTAKSNSQSAPIISGTRAKLGQFPWHILLRINRTDQTTFVICGGSIISRMWVLTAAQCVVNVWNLILVFGTIDMMDNENTINYNNIYIHPHYKHKRELTNDIALVKLAASVYFNEDFKPIELVSSAETSNNFIGSKGTITGYGTTSETDYTPFPILLWTTVKIVNTSICAEIHNIPIDNRTLCGVGWNDTVQSPCIGDAGGALVLKNKNNKLVQIGIISFYRPRCSKFGTGYVRITSYLNFIKNITKIKFK